MSGRSKDNILTDNGVGFKKQHPVQNAGQTDRKTRVFCQWSRLSGGCGNFCRHKRGFAINFVIKGFDNTFSTSNSRKDDGNNNNTFHLE